MSTFMAKAQDIDRKWYVIDAAGKPVGRVAVLAADLLRGKRKADFTPHVDCGDHVIVINCEQAVLTGNKMEKKVYYHHTGYIGGMKAVKAGTMMEKNPEQVLELAIKGMVPDTTIGRAALTRLRVYKGAEHPHAAQKPEEITL